MIERDQAVVDEIQNQLEDAIGELRGAGVNDTEIRDLLIGAAPEADREPVVCGVPISEIRMLTLDGTHWFELHRHSVGREVRPGGAVYITFHIAHAPGGKVARFGIEPGMIATVRAHQIIAVATAQEFPAS